MFATQAEFDAWFDPISWGPLPDKWDCYLCGLPHTHPIHTTSMDYRDYQGASVGGRWIPSHYARYRCVRRSGGAA